MKLENIVIVNDYSYINGGCSKVAIISAIQLSKAEYNVILFSAVEPISHELTKARVKVVSTSQYDILNNPNRASAFIQGIWNKKAEEALIKSLKTLDSENTVIHIHSWTKALSSSVIKVAVKNHFKIVLTMHDYFTACPNGGFYNYNTEEICHLKPMSKRCILCNCDSRHYYHKIWRLLRQNKQIKKGLLPNGVKNYIYISEMSKNILNPFLPEEANSYYVKNPVDIEKEEPVDVTKNNTFIYIGRLSKEKGCLLFAKAAKELKVNAVFVGDGELKDEIKCIYPEAKFTGWVDSASIKEELKNARTLVFPSLWYETLGLTALEAKAKGVPVIVSDTCSAREVIKDGETGLYFKRGSLEDLKEKIVAMMNDELAQRLGKNAFQNYWSDDYSFDNHIKQLIEVYEDILERG